MSWEKAKEIIGIIVATGTVVLVVGGFLLNVWIKDAVDTAVKAELAKISFPSDATIAEINGKNQAQDATIQGLDDRQDFTEEQLLDLGRILMQRQE